MFPFTFGKLKVEKCSSLVTICIGLFAAHAIFAQSNAPIHYYDSALGLTGPALKSALNNIIRNHTVVPYTSTQTDTSDALDSLDETPGDPSEVTLVYSELPVAKSEQYTGPAPRCYP